jgi:hypothetical protein
MMKQHEADNTSGDAAEKIDRRRGRTTLSLSAMDDLRRMARRLENYRRRTGTVVVPRGAKTRTLAEWTFNLRDTYRKSAEGRRVAWVSQRYPDLHAAMLRWAAEQKVAAAPAERFEVQVAVFLEFLVRFNRAPRQMATCKDEARLAKWLSRRLSMGAETRANMAAQVLKGLHGLVVSYRTGRSSGGGGLTYADPLFDLVADLWLARSGCTPNEALHIQSCVEGRRPFWATPEWMLALDVPTRTG